MSQGRSDPSECDSPSSKRAKYSSQDDAARDDNDDTDGCPICLESWEAVGDHRVTSLMCGHLFGKRCIERWIKQQPKCPQCNETASIQDVRILFARKLQVADNRELEQLRFQLEMEQRRREALEQEVASLKMQLQMVTEERDSLQRRRDSLAQEETLVEEPAPCTETTNTVQLSFSVAKKFPLRNSRVLTWMETSRYLMVSHSTENGLFAGHGIKMVSIEDTRSPIFIPVCREAIRDLSSTHDQSVLCAAGREQTLLVDPRTHDVVQRFTGHGAVWSAVEQSPNCVAAGLQSGHVLIFDRRNATEPLESMQTDSHSPVVRLQRLANGSLLCAQLNQVSVSTDGRFTALGPVDALNRTSACVEDDMLLVSVRPSRLDRVVQHRVDRLLVSEHTVTTQPVKVIRAGPLQTRLARSLLHRLPEELCVLAGDENSGNFKIWRAISGELVGEIQHSELVVDTVVIKTSEKTLLATVTGANLSLFNVNSK